MHSKMLNILLVEDDEVDIMNVRRAFKKNQISNPLYIAKNGVEALTMLRNPSEYPYASFTESSEDRPLIPSERRLVLLDLNMPKMNGIEFLRELRADPQLSLTPVVVLTTSNEDKDRIEAYNFQVAGYLLKPVTFLNFVDLMVALNKYWALCEMP